MKWYWYIPFASFVMAALWERRNKAEMRRRAKAL